MKDAQGKKVFLMLDTLEVHHAKPVKQCLVENREQLELVYLPFFSPELNPNEGLNAALKAPVTHQAPAQAKGDLKKAAMRHLRRLQTSPRWVMSYSQGIVPSVMPHG